MKIGIDARMMGAGYGIGRYIEQLVLNLQKVDTQNQYVLFVSHKLKVISQKSENFKCVEADIPWYSWQEQIHFSKIIKNEKVDLMHFPHWNVPLFYNEPYIVTIHDLIMFHFPRPEATTLGPIKFWLKNKIHRIVVKNAVKKAKHIITTSEFTKQDAHKTLGVPLAKMTTIYQAPFINAEFSPEPEQVRYGVKMQPSTTRVRGKNEEFPPKADQPMAGTINHEVILKKYKIEKPYVLYVGSAYPHKNLEGLLKAWKIFSNKYELDYQLVLVGKESYFYDKLRLAINNQQSVIHIGFVPDEELCVLYQNARLYIFPSLYEGFGLPPLEAIVAGAPVASSNSSCLPEVLGGGALYFDPENYEQMADVIYAGANDENIRHELRIAGKEELQKYSFERMVKETLDIYKNIKT